MGVRPLLLEGLSCERLLALEIEEDRLPDPRDLPELMRSAVETALALLGIRGGGRLTRPGRRRARRGGPCPGTGRCARAGRRRDRAAAPPARSRDEGGAGSAAATRHPPWC